MRVRRLGVVAMLGCLCVGTVVAEILCFDDFSAGLEKWDASQIEPQIRDGKVFFDVSRNESFKLAKRVPLENIVVEFDGYCESNGFNVVLAAKPGEGWSVSLGTAGNTRSLLFVGDPFSAAGESTGPAFKPGAWSRYRILHLGDRFEAYCNGKLLITADSAKRFKGDGVLSFGSWKARLGIANVTVRSLAAGQGDVTHSGGTGEDAAENSGKTDVKPLETTPVKPVVSDPQQAVDSVADGNPVVVIETSMGTFKAELWPETSPLTVANFLRYARDRFYDGTVFHRVIEGFMIQGGGFEQDLRKKPTRAGVRNEATNRVKNIRGTLAMARTRDVDSATSQFFVNLVDNSYLDHTDTTAAGFGYCVFGKVTEGIDVVDKIGRAATTTVGSFQNVPTKPIVIKSIRLQ